MGRQQLVDSFRGSDAGFEAEKRLAAVLVEFLAAVVAEVAVNRLLNSLEWL